MTLRIKRAEVAPLVEHLARKHGARVVLKGDADEMEIVKAFLELCRIPAADDFMKRYATTLVPPLLVTRPTIYLPFKPGASGYGIPSPLEQACIAGHEFKHVQQWRAHPVGWITRYATQKAERAKIEAGALGVNLEIAYQLGGGVLLHPGTLAAGLVTYGLRRVDIAVVARDLRSKAEAVKRGGYNQAITKESIAWLRARRRRGR